MQLFSNKKGTANPWVVITGIAVVVIAVALVMMVLKGGGTSVPIPGENKLQVQDDLGSGGSGGGNVFCNVEDTTWTPRAVDFYDSTLQIKGNHKYRVTNFETGETSAWATVANGGSVTVSPKDVIEVAYGDGNTSNTCAYVSLKKYTVPCKGTLETSELLYRNGTMDFTWYNKEGQVIDGLGTGNERNLTLAAGNTFSLKAEISNQFKRGNLGGYLVFDYNSTSIDNVDFEGEGVVSGVSVPQFTSRAAGYKMKAFKIPPSISSKIVSYTLTVDADDTDGNAGGAERDIYPSWYDIQGYQDVNDGEYKFGVADQDNNDVGCVVAQSGLNRIFID